MTVEQTDLALTPEEIYKITHSKRAKEQLRELARMRIPATRCVGNTVCFLWMYVTNPGARGQRFESSRPDQ